ncbi:MULTISPECIES: transglycosylase domain-containing protein [Bifidobacterium]|uniref:transglycosylase domain-containing protein n=1 Tax=Bifidobacterium TaxID=1678 RepID=UPI001BDD726E|nr:MULTISPECIES: transglycosylase domain-containing protein [Bifidobacterium]MBT1161553.1 transglycosylase domain-containing protein [Bifidobacterium sp. SO1]MBW3078929.1 transglycosylase domain-containing protein [Bifidobacterium simiiventris]
MSSMPKKNPLTISRVLALVLAYLSLCVAGGVAGSVLLIPGVFAANRMVQAIVPSLQVEGIDFDVTSLPQKSTMYAKDGTTQIAQFYEDNRIVVPIKDVSLYMRQAVVAREDRRFFEHSGVDVQGVLRAFVTNYLKDTNQGGSSLTQQYVKNVLITTAESNNDPISQYHASEDTYARKIREMLIAVQMEKKYSKLEILQGYLNIAQFGSNRLYGVETAAQYYFGVSAKDLNLVQSATIAAITKNPENYDPSIEQNQKEAQKQRNIVLDLMWEQGFIKDKSEYETAKNTPIADTLSIHPMTSGCVNAGDYAFFCDYVTHRILNSEEFGKTQADREALLKEGGLTIVTTLDVDASKLLMDTARATIPPTDPTGFEIMMASVKPGTGEVLGFGINRYYAVGDTSDDQTKTSMNYMVDQVDGGGAGFPVGSSIKPFNMVAWLQAGRSINENLQTSTVYPVSEFMCDNYNGSSQQYSGIGSAWEVTNADGGNVNPESPLNGLVRSHNTTQASMGAVLGLCRVADAYTAVGYHDASTLETIDKTTKIYVPSMMIGTVNVSPLTMANMYATLAADGVECTPIAMTKVTRKNGEEIAVPKANCHQAIDKDIAQTVAYAMNQGTVRSDGAGVFAKLSSGRKTFAKTGTNETTYMATGGFIPNEIATFVLMGDVQAPYQNQVANVSINGTYRSYWDGGTIAAPAWKAFMDAYADKKGMSVDVGKDYGNAASKYTTSSGGVTTIQGSTLSNSTRSNSSSGTSTNNSTNSNSTNSNTQGTTNNGNASNENNGGTTNGGQ